MTNGNPCMSTAGDTISLLPVDAIIWVYDGSGNIRFWGIPVEMDEETREMQRILALPPSDFYRDYYDESWTGL